MSYTDVNTPVVEQITLPSGNSFYIADREIRDVVDAISETIAGGVTYIIAWDGTSTPVVANIPAGVKVTYSGTTYTGTLAANSATPGAFYLVKSSTTPSGQTLDIYDEYVPVGATGSKTWEKIGDTQIDLSDVVTGVSLTKQTDTVVGTDATFTVTQPTVALGTETSFATGRVQVVQSVTMSQNDLIATASGAAVSASGDNVTALTGVKVTAQPTITLTANSSSATGRITYVQSQGSATTTKLSASASGGAVSASGDSVTALTGLGTPSTATVLTGVKVTAQPAVALTANNSTATGRVTYVESQGTVTDAKLVTSTASKATAATSQTTATGATTSSTTNTNLLKGISVSNGVLAFGAATLDTQTTTQHTFSDVTVATGSTAANGGGSYVVTSVGAATTKYLSASASGTTVGSDGTASAVTGYSSPTTDTVLGTASTFSVTDPSITIASGSTGDVTVATGIGNATTKYLSASASGTAVGADGTDTVLGTASTFTVTQPTVTLSETESDVDGDVTVVTAVGSTQKYLKATASGGNVAWNSKDSVTVLKNTTDVNVTKGS